MIISRNSQIPQLDLFQDVVSCDIFTPLVLDQGVIKRSRVLKKCELASTQTKHKIDNFTLYVFILINI